MGYVYVCVVVYWMCICVWWCTGCVYVCGGVLGVYVCVEGVQGRAKSFFFWSLGAWFLLVEVGDNDTKVKIKKSC